jgi:hypothetical protein
MLTRRKPLRFFTKVEGKGLACEETRKKIAEMRKKHGLKATQ